MIGLFSKGSQDKKNKLLREKKKKMKKLVKDKKYDKVLKVGEEILEKDPNDVDVLFIIGSVQYMRGKLANAMSYFDKVLAISNYDPDALLLKANVLFKQRQYVEASQCCNKIKEIDPKNKGVTELLEKISDIKNEKD